MTKTKNQLLLTGAVLLGAAPASAEFIEITQIRPGQGRYASLNVDEKIKQARKKGGTVRRNRTEIPAHNNNTSILPEVLPLPVVKGPEGYVLVDGHHDVLASIALGATTIPVKIISDASSLTPEQFWLESEKNGWVYPYSLKGEYLRPPKLFSELVDDPNRYFAALVARKCLDERTETKNTIGADYPVWIKVGKDIPFIEFEIADRLYKNGFSYDLTHTDSPTKDDVERAREILTKFPIPGLRVIKQRTHYSELPLLCVTHAAQE